MEANWNSDLTSLVLTCTVHRKVVSLAIPCDGTSSLLKARITIHPHIYHFIILTVDISAATIKWAFTTFFLKLESMSFQLATALWTIGLQASAGWCSRHCINMSWSLRFFNYKTTGIFACTGCQTSLIVPPESVCNPQNPILFVPSHIPTGLHDRKMENQASFWRLPCN